MTMKIMLYFLCNRNKTQLWIWNWKLIWRLTSNCLNNVCEKTMLSWTNFFIEDVESFVENVVLSSVLMQDVSL